MIELDRTKVVMINGKPKAVDYVPVVDFDEHGNLYVVRWEPHDHDQPACPENN